MGERRAPIRDTPMPFEERDDEVRAEVIERLILGPVMFTQPGRHALSGVGANGGGVRMPGREAGIGGLPPSNLESPIVVPRPKSEVRTEQRSTIAPAVLFKSASHDGRQRCN